MRAVKCPTVTVVTYGTMVHVSLAAAEKIGVDAEVIDVRSIVPLDVETIVNSVKKTGRCIVVHEATRFGGFGGELVATVQEECFWHLEAPVLRSEERRVGKECRSRWSPYD